MSVGLNASQARTKSTQDMIIFDETDVIMRTIISASEAGQYEAIIEDGTIMTESTPVSVLVGDVQNPNTFVGGTIIINGQTITLGTTSTNLNGIICDINDANIPGVTASKNNGYLVISIEHPQQSTWTYEVGAGTSNLDVGIYAGVYVPETPTSVDYFSVWQGVETNRALYQQMESVKRHFANLGFKIERLSNTVTNKTFKWYVYW